MCKIRLFLYHHINLLRVQISYTWLFICRKGRQWAVSSHLQTQAALLCIYIYTKTLNSHSRRKPHLSMSRWLDKSAGSDCRPEALCMGVMNIVGAYWSSCTYAFVRAYLFHSISANVGVSYHTTTITTTEKDFKKKREKLEVRALRVAHLKCYMPPIAFKYIFQILLLPVHAQDNNTRTIREVPERNKELHDIFLPLCLPRSKQGLSAH